MAKIDPLKMLLGPLAGGTIYDSPIAQFLSIKDPEEKRRLAAEAKKEEEAAAAKAGMKQAPDMKQAPAMKRGGAVKKMASGGPVKKMPMPGDSVASGNRMSKMEADERRFMDSQKPKKKTMPSDREAVDSGNRMSRLEGAEMRKMKYAKGGSASSRADGCATKGKTRGKMV
jgi:hypothetical protein